MVSGRGREYLLMPTGVYQDTAARPRARKASRSRPTSAGRETRPDQMSYTELHEYRDRLMRGGCPFVRADALLPAEGFLLVRELHHDAGSACPTALRDGRSSGVATESPCPFHRIHLFQPLSRWDGHSATRTAFLCRRRLVRQRRIHPGGRISVPEREAIGSEVGAAGSGTRPYEKPRREGHRACPPATNSPVGRHTVPAPCYE